MAGKWRGISWIASSAAALVLGGFSRPVAAASPPAVTPAISFVAQAVVASGVTPGGRVVWLGVMRKLSHGALDWSHVEKITVDASGTGNARLELGEPVAAQSIWFAVDLATGVLAAGAPAGYPLRQFALPGGAVAAASPRIEVGRKLVIVLCVRPGVGAWTLRVGDGGPGDSDGVVDGTVRIDAGQLVAIDNAASALQALAAKDLVLVVDQEQMDFTTASLN